MNQETLNCLLVMRDVRHGFLFQTVDYSEYSCDAPISKAKLASMAIEFPQLNQIHFSQGVLLSKNIYSVEELEDDVWLRAILGYPCESLAEVVASDELKWGVDIRVTHSARVYHIISFRCLSLNIDAIVLLVAKIRNALPNDTYRCTYKITPEYTEDVLIRMLSSDCEFIHIDALCNKFFNMSFSEDFDTYIREKVDFTKPKVRGILIGLLTASKFDAVSVFCPIQKHGDAVREAYEEQIAKWEAFIIKSLAC